MKREALKVGDRVKIYQATIIVKGTICEKAWNDWENVKLDDGRIERPHRKQCRRLKPRPKPEDLRERPRIRARVEFNEKERGFYKCTIFDRKGQELFRKQTMPLLAKVDGACLTEMREGEIIISRSDLAKAWDEMNKDSKSAQPAVENNKFRQIRRALFGFPGAP